MVSIDVSFNFYGCHLSRTTPRTSIHFQDPVRGRLARGSDNKNWLINRVLIISVSVSLLQLFFWLLPIIMNQENLELFCSRSRSMFLVPLNRICYHKHLHRLKQTSFFFLGIFRYEVKHNQTKAAWIRYLEMNFVEVATASRKCSDVFKFRPRLVSHATLSAGSKRSRIV